MLQTLQEALDIPQADGVSLFADNPNQDARCCLRCRQEVYRQPVSLPWGIRYGKIVCKCEIADHEEAERQRERRTRRDKMERVYKRSLMNEKLLQARLENFEPRQGTEKARAAAGAFVADFNQRNTGLMLFGNVGNGKSHLAAGIHHTLYEQGYVCLFLDCSQLFNLAKDTFRRDSQVSVVDIINAAINCDLLTLDEIGSGFLTEYEFNDILFPIINGRQGKPTNYTTNLDPDRLGKWFQKDKQGNPLDLDGRLLDRILGSCDIYENRGTSKRQEDALRRMREDL